MSKRDLFAPFRAAYKADAEKHNGPKYWRSLNHKAGEVVDEDLEFPNGTAPLTEFQRRDVLKLAGVTFAMAGLSSACVRRPEDEILPYTHQPENMIPGIAQRYASVHPRATGAVGVVVTAYEGRPVKIDGNPLHAASLGASDIWAQSEIFRLWDPDRTRQPIKDMVAGAASTVAEHYQPAPWGGSDHREQRLPGTPSSWGDFDAAAKALIDGHAAKAGKGLAFVVDGADKPTTARLLADAAAKWPEAKVYRYDAVNAAASDDGAALVFGAGARVHTDLAKASTILALDSNFLVDGPDSLALAKGFGLGRRIVSKDDAGKMSRLYAVEGTFSTTGANADHRLRLAPSKVPAFLLAVIAELQKAGVATGDLPTGAAPAGTEKFVAAVAKDLAANRGKAVVLVGERHAAAVHAVAYALNVALGAAETQLQTQTMATTASTSLTQSVQDLAKALNAGEIETLVVVDVNLAHTAPGALQMKDALKKAKTLIHAGLCADETAVLSHWHVPLAHWLESWGDATSRTGVASVVQPLILPIFGARSEVALLGGLLGAGTDDKKLVEETWQKAGVTGSEWKRALHDGVLKPAQRTASTAAPSTAALAAALSSSTMASASGAALEVALTFGPILDGRLGNLPQNQELPDSMSKLCWDNALFVSPKYAKQNNIASAVVRNEYKATIVTLDVDGRKINVPTFVMPGLEDNSAQLHLGYGRTVGLVACNVGVDAFPLLPADGKKLVVANVTATTNTIELCSTQDHFSRPGNPLNEVSFADGTTYPKEARERVLSTSFDTGGAPGLLFGTGKKGPSPIVRQGKLTLYKEEGGAFAHQGDIPSNLVARGTEAHRPARPLQPTMDITYDGQQWGMVIDMTACIGCNACTIACVAENNIPSVGRKQVLLGRELHWIRVDRYFHGDVENPTSIHQPMNCQHCENAPCEPVCPVAATIHDEEGINSMAYNRCIGTRYCANNCPYKVRRYNYLDFTVSANVYRDPIQAARAEVYKYQRNPNVTVRYRGVMEKCTYCTQRVEAAKIAQKNQGGDRKKLKDGAVVPACAQTCPTEAITFGNINDETSKVHALKKSDRNYELLQELNVRPRTTYLARLQNNNTDLEG
jgi:Fe-S-cluster-containing dehydrogenase component